VHIDDGRNYLLATRKSYDVITAEPMHPHLAGTVNLYTREYFELVRSRLRSGGICSHWIPLNKMRPMEVKQAVQAFRAVFPHTVLFVQTADAIVVGSDRPLTVDVEHWRRLLGDARVSQDLAEVGLSGLAQLLSTYMVDDAGLGRYVGGVGPVTDDRPTLEFFGSSPRAERGLAENIRQVVAQRDPLQRLLEDHLRGELTAEERADLDRLYPLENEYLLAYAQYTQGDWASAMKRLQGVLEIAPEDKRAEITARTLAGSTRVPDR
jgi:spermidine synthase